MTRKPSATRRAIEFIASAIHELARKRNEDRADLEQLIIGQRTITMKIDNLLELVRYEHEDRERQFRACAERFVKLERQRADTGNGASAGA